MSLNHRQFHFLEESNRNINFRELNSVILNSSLNEAKISSGRRLLDILTGGVSKGRRGISLSDLARLGSGGLKAWAENQLAYSNYLANEKGQGPLGRLGGEYREAGMKAFLAPYRMAPQALEGNVSANLSRTGRTSKSSLIQYGPVKF